MPHITFIPVHEPTDVHTSPRGLEILEHDLLLGGERLLCPTKVLAIVVVLLDVGYVQRIVGVRDPLTHIPQTDRHTPRRQGDQGMGIQWLLAVDDCFSATGWR